MIDYNKDWEDYLKAKAEEKIEEEALRKEIEESGEVFITCAKFGSLTSYLVTILSDDGRNFGERFSRHRSLSPTPYPGSAIELNKRLVELRESHPGCIFHLERIFLEKKGYAKSTIEAKMRIIRKHQKEGHLKRAKDFEGKTNEQVIKEHKENVRKYPHLYK